MKDLTKVLFLSTLILVFGTQSGFSHCEVPCGIYDDEARIAALREHAGTIEKSMQKIVELSGAGEKNYNQIVRWVNNKEAHATEIQHIARQYFLTQRIKPTAKDSDKRKKYNHELEQLHHMIVYAMKCKQGTDLGNVEKLRSSIESFAASYSGKPEGSHHHEGSHNH